MTTLSCYYQTPVCLPPLDPDPDKDGTPSDHMMVEMRPISTFQNKSARQKRKVTFRPLPQSGLDQLAEWFSTQKWEEVFVSQSVHQKAQSLQLTLMNALDKYLPEKMTTFSSDDQQWITHEIKQLDRKRKTEYRKGQKCIKWHSINKKFRNSCLKAKKNYYKSEIEDLKESDPRQWYSKLRRISGQERNEKVNVGELLEFTDTEQVEAV